MVRWVFNKFKRRIRKHLEREAVLITEIDEAYRSGKLTPDEMVKLTVYIMNLAKKLADRYPAYKKGLVNMALSMNILSEFMGIRTVEFKVGDKRYTFKAK